MKEKLGKETEGNSNTKNNMWHTSRNIHCKSFEGVCSYIEDIIIDWKEFHLAIGINFQYKTVLTEIGQEKFNRTQLNRTLQLKSLRQNI